MDKPRISNVQSVQRKHEVEAKPAGPTNLALHSRTHRSLDLVRSQRDSIQMEPNDNLSKTNPKIKHRLIGKPTTKLMEAVQNQQTDSKPLQVKILRRDSNEDTSEYESDSSIETLSANSPHPKDRPKIDISSMLEQGQLDISQIPEKQAVPEVDFTGIPTWFPLKIKLILTDKGFPDALPFKAVHKLTRYRAWLEARRRQRWRRYLKAGKCRWQLSNTIKKLRDRPGMSTGAFLDYRISQGAMWKRKAIRAMRKLDAMIEAIRYLDRCMAGIFEEEREVYGKYLD